jgi:His/Glu/Gln/Arg/opine family amino acid ABC transporter permease subunit
MAIANRCTMNSAFLYQFAPLLAQGLFMTIVLWIGALGIALSVGIITGIIRSRALRVQGLSRLCDGMVFVLRGIPFYVQLLIAYYVIPDLLGMQISARVTGIVSLGLCSAAYVSQIVSGGINAIADEQWQAAYMLGLNRLQTVWYVILPQTIRIVLPMLAGESDQLLKSTSIISTIGVIELTRAGMNIVAREMQVVPVYMTVACLYLLIFAVFTIVTKFIEKRIAYDYR